MFKKLLKVIAPLLTILIGMVTYCLIFKKEKNEGCVTVFVHGYKGTYNTFGPLIRRFEKKYRWGKKAAIYYISSSSEIHVKDLKNIKHENTFIQVIFENNRASFEDYTTWLSLVIEDLNNKYQHVTFNLVGHSMGGITAIKYLEDYQNSRKFPRIEKLILLGSPFDGVYSKEYFEIHKAPAATDLKHNSTALQLLRNNSYKIPKSIDVLSIGSTGDVIAEPKSVNTISEIVDNRQLKKIMIDRKEIGHSELHEDEDVDHMIYSFLWK